MAALIIYFWAQYYFKGSVLVNSTYDNQCYQAAGLRMSIAFCHPNVCPEDYNITTHSICPSRSIYYRARV